MNETMMNKTKVSFMMFMVNAKSKDVKHSNSSAASRDGCHFT
jgi:hypothetical protein